MFSDPRNRLCEMQKFYAGESGDFALLQKPHLTLNFLNFAMAQAHNFWRHWLCKAPFRNFIPFANTALC
jgi:hypothetical protein